MTTNNSSRRDFLKSALSIGALSIGAGAVLSACGKEKKAAESAGGCNDVSGLADGDKALRTANNYADTSAKPDQTCEGCQLYKVAAAGAACGGCQVLKGPIAPKGWCKLWAKKVA